MQASNLQHTRDFIAHAFRDAMSAAISEISTLDWQIHKSDGALAEKPHLSSAAGFQFNFNEEKSGEVIIGIAHDVLPRLKLIDSPEETPDATTVQKEKLLTALEGELPLLVGALSKAGALTIQVELVDGPTLRDHEVVELVCRRKSEGDDTSLQVFVCISAKFIADLQDATAAPFVFPHAAEAAGTNLDLVMDVELNVTLRFGQRQLALREVLELASGSVVELDRQVDEPIELILDGKVVARGEAVIIDGNYGMRVTQVLQPLSV